MRDSMWDDTAVRLTLPPALRTNGTVNGTAVDTRGNNNFFQVGMLVVSAGVITDGSNAITVQDSDDGSTGWTAYAGATQGSIPAIGTAQGSTPYRMALDAFPRRFIRAVCVTTGATTGGTIGVGILLRGDSGARAIT